MTQYARNKSNNRKYVSETPPRLKEDARRRGVALCMNKSELSLVVRRLVAVHTPVVPLHLPEQPTFLL